MTPQVSQSRVGKAAIACLEKVPVLNDNRICPCQRARLTSTRCARSAWRCPARHYGMDIISVQVCAGRFICRGFTFFLNLLSHKFEADGKSQLLYRDVTHKWNVQERWSQVISIKGW
jgi:hypothetical protein